MCGRFTLSVSAEDLARLFSLDPAGMPPLLPRYNIAPTQPVLAVRDDRSGGREAVFLRWGLIPPWARDPAIGGRLINARSETAADKPSFRSAFRRRRCLVPADGFYEWRAVQQVKQPYHLHAADGGPFAIAGLWERWSAPDGLDVETCTLLTTAANEAVAALHDRMPVIMAPPDFDRWLDPDLTDPRSVEDLLRPAAADFLAWYPVGSRVNRAGEEGADLRRPLAAP
jgi:putative SOS response-associated peptidase YedK